MGNLALDHPPNANLDLNRHHPASDSVSTQRKRTVPAADRTVDIYQLVVSQNTANYQYDPVRMDDVVTSAGEFQTRYRSLITTGTLPIVFST